MPPSVPVLELENVALNFENHTVLNRVSLQIFSGDSVVIIGPSGQGKSVTLKLLAGLILPSSGKVKWGGEDVLTLRGEKRVQWMQKMGMLFQKNALFDSLTVAENVAFPLEETTELEDTKIEERVDFFLKAVGLDHVQNLYPNEISGGMQKRLGIARALALEPEIIFYDDPTAGLDPITSRKIIQLILDLRQKMKSTIVTITNDMNRAYQLAGQIAMVVDGELILTGGVEETKNFSDPRVQQFIQGRLEGPLTTQSSGERLAVKGRSS